MKDVKVNIKLCNTLIHYIQIRISVIYGLDADLIMLSMLRNNKIYLLRKQQVII